MPYQSEISRNNPMCFLFLIDQSGSMNDTWSGETSKKKANGVADIINRLLQELVLRCAKAEGVRDYFHVGVIGYGAQVGPAFGGGLAGQELVPISQVGEMPANIEERAKKIDDGAGGLVEQKIRFPVWFTPVANGGTPMRQAFSVAIKTTGQFLAQHPDCFPPIVIHLTDGESTDGDPSDLMRELTLLESSDGNVLLFNYHISSSSSNKIAFPHSLEQLPNDQYGRMLFDGASELTEYMRDAAKREHNLDLPIGAKGYIFNADSVLVIQALDIGTRVSNLR
jgi:uncharacterized protein YegL